MKPITAYIGLGSNIDDRKRHIVTAIDEINLLNAVHVMKRSSIYRSPPMAGMTQPDYFNAVIQVNTSLSPFELLSALQMIEDTHGRTRTVKWGSRTLDLDLLVFGNAMIDTHVLTVPHYGLKERDFVLAPLCEIDEALVLPDGSRIKQLLSELNKISAHKLS
ncbi:MAG: 2-amino-4-hydroxy-6-hydroxymethyldihydropteridine diphosphokinase [Pseudomonadota bacterium]